MGELRKIVMCNAFFFSAINLKMWNEFICTKQLDTLPIALSKLFSYFLTVKAR